MGADSNIAEKVKAVIAERMERKLEEVTDDAKIQEDLGADSLDITEMMMLLEEEFNIEMDDDANNIVTVGDAIKYIESRI